MMRWFAQPGIVERIILLGFGVVNLMFGIMVLCSRDKIALMRLVRPEAPSECPRLGLTYGLLSARLSHNVGSR